MLRLAPAHRPCQEVPAALPSTLPRPPPPPPRRLSTADVPLPLVHGTLPPRPPPPPPPPRWRAATVMGVTADAEAAFGRASLHAWSEPLRPCDVAGLAPDAPSSFKGFAPLVGAQVGSAPHAVDKGWGADDLRAASFTAAALVYNQALSEG